MRQRRLISKSKWMIFHIFIFLISSSIIKSQQQLPLLNRLELNNQQFATQDNIKSSKLFLQNLNSQIQTLNLGFLPKFIQYFHKGDISTEQLQSETIEEGLYVSRIDQNPGYYLLLLAKMYLYQNLPTSMSKQLSQIYISQSSYMLAYFYLKISAQKYSNAQAYYLLAVLDYHKLNPHQFFLQNLEKQVQKISKQQGYQKVYSLKYKQLIDYLKNYRFSAVERQLFMSSMLGHEGASLVIANMNYQGLGTEKNCTTALAYYISVVKKSYVDFYMFRNSYSDQNNFEKQLYSKKKITFATEVSAQVVGESQFFDTETIKATYQLADSYFLGKDGFIKNYKKAAQLYAKLAEQDHKNSQAMLGMCYFKGQGVNLDRKRAKRLFEQSSKVSLSQSMLIVMDYFQIQSKGNRKYSIKRMKQIHQKKKESMNPILKYLYGSLIIKGDVDGINKEDGVLLLGGAAKEGHLMAKIAMGLLFTDGIDVNYDCKRAVGYFAEQSVSHPFFMDKFYLAKIGLRNQKKAYSLFKYLQLSLVGDTNSFINALYMIEIQKKNSLRLNPKSWSLKTASQNLLYIKLKKLQIVPDIHSFFIKQFNFADKKIIKYNTLQRFLQGTEQNVQMIFDYIKKKIIKNSLMNFYQHKMSVIANPTLLSAISNSDSQKLHVMQSRFLLGQYYHNLSHQSNIKDNSKQQYKALQQYKRATNSQLLGKVLFYIEEFSLAGMQDTQELWNFGVVEDAITMGVLASIVAFVFYYQRQRKLQDIHEKEMQKRIQQERITKQASQHQFKQAFAQDKMQQKQYSFTQPRRLLNENQPQIIQQRLNSPKGHRIGSSQQEDDLIIVQNYEISQQQDKLKQK